MIPSPSLWILISIYLTNFGSFVFQYFSYLPEILISYVFFHFLLLYSISFILQSFMIRILFLFEQFYFTCCHGSSRIFCYYFHIRYFILMSSMQYLFSSRFPVLCSLFFANNFKVIQISLLHDMLVQLILTTQKASLPFCRICSQTENCNFAVQIFLGEVFISPYNVASLRQSHFIIHCLSKNIFSCCGRMLFVFQVGNWYIYHTTKMADSLCESG